MSFIVINHVHVYNRVDTELGTLQGDVSISESNLMILPQISRDKQQDLIVRGLLYQQQTLDARYEKACTGILLHALLEVGDHISSTMSTSDIGSLRQAAECSEATKA